MMVGTSEEVHGRTPKQGSRQEWNGASPGLQGLAPRILVYFRSIISAPGASLSETTTKRSIELTFQFQKRTVVSGLTSYFDKESVLAVPAEHISSGKPGEPPGRELVSILGGRVAGVVS